MSFVKDTDPDMIDREANAIAKTICTRYMMCREGSSVSSMIDKISSYDYKSMQIEDQKAYKRVEDICRSVLASDDGGAWKNKSILVWNSKEWSPSEEERKNYDFDLEYSSKNFNFWTMKVKDSSSRDVNAESLTNDEKFLARVIYSETSICDQDEVKLVCRVIMNRVGKRDFGDKTYSKPSSAYEVVNVKVRGQAFSCIGDKNTSNWNSFKPDLNAKTKQAAEYAKLMMSGDKSFTDSLSEYRISSQDLDSIVYYHNAKLPNGKYMPCPPSWTNKYWRPILVLTTRHFKFYKIVENKKQG